MINKITPFLDSINKVTKASGSENMSENKSSISKAEKNITPFYKATNENIFKAFVKSKEPSLFGKRDQTIRVR